MKKARIKYISMRKRILRVMSILCVCIVIALGFILTTVMLRRMEILEKSYVGEQIEVAHNAIEHEQEHLSEVVYDLAVWDSTYEYMKNKNSDFIMNNLNKDRVMNFGVNTIVFFDESGVCIYSVSIDNCKKKIIPVTHELIKILYERDVNKNIDSYFRLEGLIILPEGPMLISSCPVVQSNGHGPVRGNIVFGTYIDDAWVKLIQELFSINFDIERLDKLDSTEYKIYESISDNRPIAIHLLNEDNAIGYALFNDIYGKPALGLKVEMKRPIANIGRDGIRVTIIYIIVVSIGFSILIILFLEKYILKRLLSLSSDIRKIGRERLFSSRLIPDEMEDELTIVSYEINIMLDELEKSQHQVNETKKDLSKANEELEKRVQDRTEELLESNESLQLEITERKKIQEKIKHLAYHDNLTDLPNRLYFMDKLKQSISISKQSDKMLAIMFLDLDGFKIINDSLGHTAGDKLLKEVSLRLLNILRKSDIVARFGGDEFCIIVENIEDINAVKIIANKIIKIIGRPFMIENQDCFVTTSIGIALYPEDGENIETLIKNADIAMYKAKEKGKNNYSFCTPTMKTAITNTMKIINQLHKALEFNELELYYQPQVECSTHKIIGVESLLRWNHPKYGFMEPDKFINIAEQSGLIIPIGEWVIKTACNQIKMWQDANYPKIRIGINFSIKQFYDHNIVNKVKNILSETGIEPNFIELEITESIGLQERNYIVETLNAFRKMGFKIAIDDFGTEYSSLSYLKSIPVDKIKIAMSFIQGIEKSSKDKAIVKAIIVLAKNMELGIIAEGVETKEQLDFLTESKCDEIQGYYFYKPMTAKEMGELLKKLNK